MTDIWKVNFLFTFYLNRYFKIKSEYENFIFDAQYVFSETLFPLSTLKRQSSTIYLFSAFSQISKREENMGYKMTLVDL